MASYAALVSLIHVLNRIQRLTFPASFDKLQIQSLSDKVNTLVDFLEHHSHGTSNDSLTTRMSNAAYAAEDTIESYVVSRIREGNEDRSDLYIHLCQDLEKIIQEMDLINQEVMEVKEKDVEMDHHQQQQPKSSSVTPSGPIKMVGFDKQLEQVMELIRTNKSSREIIPVVGMGGIGKTTLAKHVYDSLYVRSHFDTRAWVTISQDYTVREIIQSLLHDIGVGEMSHLNDEQLTDILYQSLSRRRYLVVLDDTWDILAWTEIRRFLPDNGKGSRILLTTRISSVAMNVGNGSSPYEVKLLDDDKSLILLSHIIFGLQVCPPVLAPELVKCVEKIAKSCKGLPLTIVVVGGLLKTSQMSLKFWEYIAENLNSFINRNSVRHCSEVLSLSYNHLPVHLKPCFLYMVAFKETREIRVSILIKLWVADGFLRPTGDTTLEEVAFDNLNALIDRNLVMVSDRSFSDRILSCTIHDLLRDLCLREAQDKNFFCLVKDNILNNPQTLESARRVACHRPLSRSHHSLPSMPFTRSMFDDSPPPEFTSGCRLLRVLHVNHLKADITHLLNLRNLRCARDSKILISSISLLWNLETLFIGDSEDLVLPREIWDLPNLRHLQFQEYVPLPDPPGGLTRDPRNHLQTLKGIKNFHCTEEVLNRIPNLNKLGVSYDLDYISVDSQLSFCFANLARLDKLETLSCSFDHYRLDDICIFNDLENLMFPPNLTKLTLSSSNIPWEHMTIIGSLPNLEVLKLNNDAFCGAVWNPTDEEFQSLTHLLVYKCALTTWGVNGSLFPSLKMLSLWFLDMEELPLGMADLPSLESINLGTNKLSAVISANEILKKLEQGNEHFSIDVQYLYSTEQAKTEVENMDSHKFRVNVNRDY